MPSEKQIARWTVKGWNDDHIEYEDGEGKYVLYSDYIAALTSAEQAEPATDAEPVAWLMREQGTTVTLNKVQADEWGWDGKDIQPLFTRQPDSRLREALEGVTLGRCGSEVTIFCNDSEEADKLLDFLILAQEDGR